MNLSKSYQDLISCCNHRIMVLDGDFGTELQRQNVTEAEFRGKMFADHFVNLKGDNEVLCLTAPDKVKDVHQAYLAAGADLIRTNTFGATSFGQAKYRLQHMAYDIAKAGAQVAREALKEHNDRIRVMGNLVKPKFVVGSVGPIGKTAGISPRETGRTVTFGDLVNAYGEQIRGLLDGGADALLVESVSDTLDCKAALYAICKECEKRGELFPIMVSVSITGEGEGHLKDVYIESVVYKGEHNEIILESDTRKWLMLSDTDEQVATYVPLWFDFSKASFEVIDSPDNGEGEQ